MNLLISLLDASNLRWFNGSQNNYSTYGNNMYTKYQFERLSRAVFTDRSGRRLNRVCPQFPEKRLNQKGKFFNEVFKDYH